MNDERNLLDHIRVLIRWRRMIIISFVLVVISTIGISFLLPKAYRASAIVYPPLDSKGALGLGNLLGDLQGSLLGSLGGESVSATEFVPILQSERVRIAVADSFRLFEKYGAQHRSELLDKMTNNLQVALSREQFLSISYEADTPQLSADITNAFVAELEKALQERTRKQKRTYREYLERRLQEAERDMFDAEQRYKNFQKENMAIDMETQAKAQIESASTIIQSLVDLIVKRDIAAQMMTPDNPNLKQLNMEIRTTNRALDHLLMGSSADSSEQKTTDPQLPAIFKPFNQMPQLGLTSLQLLRDIQIQNAIYQFVKQEYEKTRFEEEKVSSAVIVLDKAVPPDVRSKPRRTMMVLIAGGLSLAISCLFAFLFEAIGNLTPENRAKIDAITSDLQGRSRT